MKVTMNDVAKCSGVSVTTVSHVLNGTRAVAGETKKRVLDTIKELGYIPDQTARGLKTGRRNLVGFIVPNIANPAWSNIITGVEESLSEENIPVIVMNTRETPEREKENIRTLCGGMVDGMIIATSLESYAPVREILPQGFPVVFIDRMSEGYGGPAVLLSAEKAVYRYVSEMAGQGREKIGCLLGLGRLSTSREKREAYTAAMRDAGLEIEDGFILSTEDISADCRKQTELLLGAGCTAIVTSNSVVADNVKRSLGELGERERVSVLGYMPDDDTRYTEPENDYYVIQPCRKLGRMAGERIKNAVCGDATGGSAVIECGLKRF